MLVEVEEEKKKKEEKERWRTLGERREELAKRKRRRNLMWRGIERESTKEREGYMRGVMERALGRKVEVRGVEERIGEGGRKIMLVVMREDRDEILERRKEIWGEGGGWRWMRI